ncbi:MAG: S8 family serine peptidase [Bryobacterales bacterium]|nr:S8 family serine peptidase [Bryobacterales bacterium]
MCANFTRPIRQAVFAGVLLSLSAGSMPAQQARISGRIDNSRTVVLPGRVSPRAHPEDDLGQLAPSAPMRGMTLLLKPSAGQQSSLDQLLAQQREPASPNFRRWLTPEQYAERFGASNADIAKITSWLESQGFEVDMVARSRTWITFSGTAGQTRGAFHTAIHRYLRNGEVHYSNVANPAVPAALAPLVAGIRGLNNFRLKPRSRRKPEMTSSNGLHSIAPDDFAIIYNVAPLYQAGIDGSGMKIAVVGQTGIRLSDIDAFRSRFHLATQNVQQILVPKRPDPGVVTDELGEADLDIEWAGAVARNATTIYVYSDDVWQSALYAIDQNVAPVLSMSYGNCEESDLVDLPAFQSAAQQANAQGMTFLAAAGDAGAADCEDLDAYVAENGFAVDAPSSVPEVTAMGGTQFNEQGGSYWSNNNTANGASALSYIPEMAWNDTAAGGGLAATGGGSSVFFPRPSWQAGPGVPNDSFRHVPDLALNSSAEHDGYYVYSGGSSGLFGGTSAAAPSMAGIICLLNQYLVSTGALRQPGLGNINPALYRLAQSTTGIFHDVTAGNNTVPCVPGSPDCANGQLGITAGPGYDRVTGLGSVDAYNLVHQWTSRPAVNASIVASIDQNPVFQQPRPDSRGNQWVFTLTLNEEAGIGARLTGLSIDGTSYDSQITSFFGTDSIAPGRSISATLGFQTLSVPRNVAFVFSGVDAAGGPWTVNLSIPFQGVETALAVGGLSNAASGQQAYAPGMIMAVYGTAMGNFAQLAGAVPLPQYLAGFEATVNGVAAPLYYVSPGQVNVQIPYETQPGQATLVIGNPYENVSTTFTVVAAAPGIFLFPDGSVNPSRSGSRGQIVTMFITGEGQVRPSLATGETPSPLTSLSRLPRPVLPVTVTVGGVAAAFQFVGIPPGLVGVTQINFVVPLTAPLGRQQVVAQVGNVSSPPANFMVNP